MAVWPDSDAHPDIDDLRCDSPLEQRFAWFAHKYLREHDLRSQVPVGPYRLDFVFGPVAFECDGFRFHSSSPQQQRDARRDTFILQSGAVTALYRIPGHVLHAWPEACFATFAAWNPEIFSSRGLINLERYAQESRDLGIVRKTA